MDERQQRLLSGLVEKYRAISRLRARAACDTRAEAHAQMRELARRFPGALRELDCLSDAQISTRLAALEASLVRGAPERWMLLQASYHGYMRAALRLRRVLRASSSHARAAPPELAALGYTPAEDEPLPEHLDAGALFAIVRPAGGRLNPWVLAAVAELHQTSGDEVRRALLGD